MIHNCKQCPHLGTIPTFKGAAYCHQPREPGAIVKYCKLSPEDANPLIISDDVFLRGGCLECCPLK